MSTVRWVDMAVAQVEAADKVLSKAVDEATATECKADQLKEPKLLDKLDTAIRKAKALKGVPNDAPSEWLAWRLASARKANATDADEANAQVKALNAALKAVRDSRLAKELDTAKSQLKQGIDSASQTLKDTDGTVADNATRDALSNAIDAANGLKDGNDPAKIDGARKTLEDAINGVNASVQAKTDADAQAAAAAAAAAQAQAQAQSTYNGVSSYPGGAYRRTEGSTSGSNTYRGTTSGGTGSGSTSGSGPAGGSAPKPNLNGAYGCGNSCTGKDAGYYHH